MKTDTACVDDPKLKQLRCPPTYLTLYIYIYIYRLFKYTDHNNRQRWREDTAFIWIYCSVQIPEFWSVLLNQRGMKTVINQRRRKAERDTFRWQPITTASVFAVFSVSPRWHPHVILLASLYHDDTESSKYLSCTTHYCCTVPTYISGVM